MAYRTRELSEAELRDVYEQLCKAYVALYDGIDGVSDEMSSRDHRLTQEHYYTYLHVKGYLDGAQEGL